MLHLSQHSTPACVACRVNAAPGFDFTMAFQPFVDLQHGSLLGYEALIRGREGEGAQAVLARVTDENRYWFDQACRVKAIELATALGLQGLLSINFLPNAVYRPETCIRATLAAAKRLGFPRDRLMFEVTEGEKITDVEHLRGIFTEYKKQGFRTAIDDFGAGWAGLNLLAEFQPDYLKLDMALTRNIHRDPVRRAIVRGVLSTCEALSLRVIAEGVETRDECMALTDLGVRLFQGYLFARPGLESLPDVPAELVAALRGAIAAAPGPCRRDRRSGRTG